MSELVPSVVPLSLGLNLQMPKLVAPPGSLLSCLNYEQVDFVGQKRIDGYVRYDGNMLPVLDDYLVVATDPVLSNAEGDFLYVGEKFWGRLLAVEDDLAHVAVYNQKLTPRVGESFIWDGEAFSILSLTNGRDVEGITAEQHYENLLKYMNVLREEVGDLPPVAGLHWHEDRLYAIADVVAVVVNIEELCVFIGSSHFGGGGSSTIYGDPPFEGMPSWFNYDEDFEADFYGDGNWIPYSRDSEDILWYQQEGSTIYGYEGRGYIRQIVDFVNDAPVYETVCVDWSIPAGA